MIQLLTFLLVLAYPWSLQAAETVRYINKDLASGSNNGTSSANAYRGLNALENFRNGSGGSTIDRVIFEGAGVYRESFSSVSTRVKTDLSFTAATNTITSASSNFTTIGFVTGDIIRVIGSASNDRQFTVGTVGTTTMTVHSTNILTEEAAGASINITAMTRGSNLASLDPGGNGTAARPRRWQFNGSEIDSGVTLNAANGYTWTASATKAGEWYVTRSDGSNPSLLQPFCGVLDGTYISDSADLGLDMGTVGSLTSGAVMGWGDNDSIGYSTVYLKSDTNPGTRTVRVGQGYAGISTTWQYHSFEDGIFTLGTRDSGSSSSRGVGISNRSTTTWWIKRNIFKYQSTHAIEHGSTGQTLAYSNLTYFSGHRGYSLIANGDFQIYHGVDYGSHLFVNTNSGLTSSALLTIRNCISMYNEAGAIAKASASAILTEDHNIWYPRFGAAGNALGYTSTANWTTTAASDYPPSADTTLSTIAANLAAGAVNPLFMNPASLDFRLQPTSVGKWSGQHVMFARDYLGKRFSPSHPTRGLYEFGAGNVAGTRSVRP